MELKKLSNWEDISKEDYNKYSIVEVGFMKCESAYLKKYKGQNIIITLYNYGAVTEDAFDGIEQALFQNEKENYLIDGNPNSAGY